jgi:tetratricopeptide (TPR) repeat protein
MEIKIEHSGAERDFIVQQTFSEGGTYITYTVPPPDKVEPISLEDAAARLAALPLDTLPEISSLPPGSRLPFDPNPHFVGRTDTLASLAQALKGEPTSTTGHRVALTGWGGIGKSQLAVEFAHRYGPYFAGGVYWISMADPASVESELILCAQRGMAGLPPSFAWLDHPAKVQAVQAAWESPLPRLLIFDNCENPELLAKYLPKTGAARVLVTSRRQNWPSSLLQTLLSVEVLERAESLALLGRFYSPSPDAQPALDDICEELGDLPLALHLAGSYMRRLEVAPSDYLAVLQQDNPLAHWSLKGLEDEPSPTQHAQSVAQTFALSYQQLDRSKPVDELASALLTRLSTFALGESVPRFLLLLTAGIPEISTQDGQLELKTQEAIWRQGMEAIHRLENLGLIAVSGPGITIHRLIAGFIRSIDSDVEQLEARQTIEGMLLSLAQEIYERGYPRLLLPWQAHFRHIVDQALLRHDRQAARAANLLGLHLHQLGDLAGARPYYEQALAIDRQVSGEQHPDTAQSLNNLGGLLKNLGDLAAARPYFEQALAIDRQVLGEQHPDTARSLNNLGGLLKNLGDLAAARPYYERALAIQRRVLGEQHPDTARSLNNLGRLLQAQGNLAEARLYCEQALAINRQVLGEQHPDTAGSLNSLGGLLRAQGNLAKARLYCEQALAIDRQVLGEHHPNTARSLNNLGRLLQEQGDLAGARLYYEQALAIYRQVLGEEHPDTARSLNNLGALLQAQGDLAAAKSHLEQALAIRRQVLGEGHPDTASSLNNLGALLRAQGDLAGAKPYYEQALAILEARLGPDHPTTQIVRNNLTALLAALQNQQPS